MGFRERDLKRNILSGSGIWHSSVILSAGLAAGLIYIYIFPYYHSDDFYIYRVVRGSSVPISISPGEIFHLFLRPVSYFSFYLDNYFFPGSPAAAKLISLCLHLALVWIILLFIKIIGDGTGKLQHNHAAAGPLVLCFLFHPDTASYIGFANNRTEILMLLFYSAACLIFMLYVKDRINTGVFASLAILFYLLSVLSKQTGLHLPLLFLWAVWLFKPELKKQKAVIIVSAAMLTFAAIFIYFNYTLLKIDPSIIESFWKKPFTAAGIMVFVLFPFAAEEVYTFFLFNDYTLIIAAVILTAVIIFILLKKQLYKYIFPAVIIFFPRILSTGSGRINTLLLFWLIILLTLIVKTDNIFVNYSIVLYSILLLVTSVSFMWNTSESEILRQKKISELHSVALVSEKKLFIPLADHASFIDEYNYYHLDSLANSSGHGTPLVFKSIFNKKTWGSTISCSRKENRLIFSSTNEKIFIGESPANRMKKTFTVFPIGPKKREYNSFSVILPDSIIENYILVFDNGQEWKNIN